MNGLRYRYGVYGIVVVSDTPLALPLYADAGLGSVELHGAPASMFLAATAGLRAATSAGRRRASVDVWVSTDIAPHRMGKHESAEA